MTQQINKAKAIWMRMSFWERLERSLTTLGGTAVLFESILGAGALATGITAAFTLIAQHLSIWIDDQNKDGVPDLFQESIDIHIDITNRSQPTQEE